VEGYVMKMIAIVDVDETLWGFNSALRECALSHGYPFPTMKECNSWGAIYDFIPKPEAIKLFDEVHENQLKYAPFPDAKEFLEFMCHHFYVIVASHRNPDHLPQLKDWLEINKLKHNEISVSFDKTVLFDNPKVAVVIDDRDETLSIAMDRGKIAVGLRRPWNQNAVHKANYKGKEYDVPLVLFESLTEIKDWLEHYTSLGIIYQKKEPRRRGYIPQ
jgi:hypothetical protein